MYPLSEHAQQVMQLASKEARLFNHEYVGTEHVLLGLLSEEHGVASQVLMNVGLRTDRLRKEIAELSAPECTEDVASVVGQLRRHVRSHTPVDQALSNADKRDTPTLFTLQFIALVVAMTSAVLLGAGAVIVMAALIVRFVVP